ncbi:MAG: hypothetical protein DRH33_01755 [Candidatus Nealsonbacteria bacterium]|nr:MAG: hypothetical protein DRH33_01755 [Candidatus Nealsonbacteria bacterium]
MFTNLKRILKFGWQSFVRNKGLSFQVIFIMIVAVLTVTSLFLLQEISSFLISEIQKKVDIAVYFKKDVDESQILEVKKALSEFSDKIESIDYISKNKAQEIFLQKHKKDPLYLQALEEIGENPFLASLNIKAKSPNFYANISDFLVRGPFQDIIEKVSYYESEKVINRLFSLTEEVKTIGIGLSIIVGILVLLITFNTVKLTIFAFRDEITTMKLVGASNWFIRGPFLVQSLFYGIFGVLIADLILFTTLYFFNSRLERWLLNFDLLSFFQENLLFLILIQLGFTLFLGIVSTTLAVRKYLKV